MAAISLVTDFAVYRMAKVLGVNPWNCLTILASSYVTLVFNTRTFSNAFECAGFAMLLMLVVISRQDQLKPLVQSTPKEEKSGEGDEGEGDGKKKQKKQKKKVTSPPVKRSSSRDSFIGFWLGVFIAECTFSRPTFPAFFLIPIVFWVTGKETSLSGRAIMEIIKNVFFLLPGFAVMSLFCVVTDSIYYETLDGRIFDSTEVLLEHLDSDLFNNLTITPWNFLKYNLQDDNLAEHGIHPRITHFMVNMPMLFLPFFVCILAEIHSVYKARSQNRAAGFTASTSRAFLLLTVLSPIMLLSCLPHQEQRFIIPVITPLVLLYSNFVTRRGSSFPSAPFILFNVLGCFVFGQLHQGGLVDCIEHLRGVATKPVVDDTPMSYHYVFYHTYMPPRHLFQMTNQILPANANLEDDEYKPIMDKGENVVQVHDLMGAGRLDMHRVVEQLLSDYKTPIPPPYEKKIMIVSPASLDPIFCRLGVKYNFKLKAKFGSHLSMEDPPEWFPTYKCVSDQRRGYHKMKFREKLETMFSLFVYEVEIVRLFPPEKDPVKIAEIKRKRKEGWEQRKSKKQHVEKM